jgi:hypothetical protein
MKMLLRVTMTLLLWNTLSWAGSHDDICVDLLPPEAEAAVQAQFPALYPEKMSDLSVEYREAWLNKHPQECPGIAVGHFLSASGMSYAVLLVGSKGGLSGSTLVVVAKSAKAAWKVTKVAEEKMSYHYEAIFKVGPSKGLQRLQLKEFDGDATNFYWSAGRFHKVAVRE